MLDIHTLNFIYPIQTKTIILRSENCNQDTWLKFSSHKTTQRSLEFCLASVLYSLTLQKRKKFQGLGTVWPLVVFEPWEWEPSLFRVRVVLLIVQPRLNLMFRYKVCASRELSSFAIFLFYSDLNIGLLPHDVIWRRTTSSRQR